MWNDCKNNLTAPLTKESNVGTFHLAPGYSKYNEFCCMLAEDEQDREADPIISTEPASNDNDIPVIKDEKWNKNMERQSSLQGDNSIEMNWELNDKNVEEFNNLYPENKIQLPNIQSDQGNILSQLLKLHQRFGHISFAK